MTITLLLIIIVFTISGGYFGYRAYILAGLLADQQQYIDELEFTYSMVLDKTKEAYEEMKRIDTVGAFQSDDESGTTFLLLKQVIDDLYKETNGTQEEEK
jgi:hypothetical protein|tara:strand:- start:1222 stop:1521 length:300 start_codon:yes stop_codon:yes gene_type:complete